MHLQHRLTCGRFLTKQPAEGGIEKIPLWLGHRAQGVAWNNVILRERATQGLVSMVNIRGFVLGSGTPVKDLKHDWICSAV